MLLQVGVQETLQKLRSADFGLLGLALALFMFGVYLRTFRWRALLADRGLHVPIRTLTQLYFIGQFFNTFLPTGFGGDVVRVIELNRHGVSKAESVSTVFLDRLTGLLAFFLMTLAALPFAGALIPAEVRWVLVGLGIAGVVGTGLMFEHRFTTPLIDRLFMRVRFPLKAKAERLYQAMRANSPQATLKAMLVGFMFNLLLIAINYLVGRALGQNIALGYFFLYVPIISTLLLLPISLNGLGVREGAYVLLFASAGVSSASAASMSLAFWAITVAAGLAGGALYAMQGARGAFRIRAEG
ncbi:MAG: flippase-like domain-containing protein [Chloroflexi bacterium]|nr:flippase-like domain-containing protein [Chloroflexota bacterium]